MMMDEARVIVRPATLAEVWAVALESGEWRQIRHQMRDSADGRCAYGVLLSLWERMGAGEAEQIRWWDDLLPVMDRAAAALGHGALDCANDAGCTFAEIAHALRNASDTASGTGEQMGTLQATHTGQG